MMFRILLACALSWVGSAQAQMNSFFPGPGTVHSVAAGYIGPGDVAGYSGAYAYWGLRGYNAAYSTGSNPAADLIDQAGANLITINILANGNIDVASINAWVTANSVTTIRVAKLYDQSGNARHLDQTIGGIAQPTLVMSGVGFGSIPVLAFNSTGTLCLFSTGNAATQSQPFTLSAVTRNPTFATGGRIFSNGTAIQAATDSAAVSWIFAGSATGTASTVPDNQWAALQEVFTGASSTINSSNSGTNPSASPTTVASNPGTNGLGNSAQLAMGCRATGATSGDLAYDGHIFEMMIIPNAVSSGNQALQAANQRAYGGGF